MPVRRAAANAVLLLMILLLPASALAQQADPFAEILDVQLTNIDVVATDADGRPVTGLTAADFEILEDGKPQTITNFSAVGDASSAVILPPGGTARPAPARQIARKYIFYFDDATLTSQGRQAIFQAIPGFLAANMRPGDQAMVVSWNRELKVRQAWTSDQAAVLKTIQVMAGELASSAQMQAEKQRAIRLLQRMEDEANDAQSNMKPLWSELENAVRSYAEMYKYDVSRSTNAMLTLLGTLAGVDGRKVLVIATETLPTLAGAELFAQLDNIRNAAMANPSSSLYSEARRSSRVTDVNRYNVAPMLEVLARAANATGVTVYGINPTGLSGPAAGKADRTGPRDTTEEFAEAEQILGGIKMLASRTGGTALVGAPAPKVLEHVGVDLDSGYSLAYRSLPGTAADRKLEVRSRKPGVHVRARTNVHYRAMDREMADRVIANQLQAHPANDLGVTLEADAITAEGSRQLLPVRVIIPMDGLTLLPDASGSMTGGFSVFTCSGDGAGAASGVNVQSHALTFTPEQFAQMKGRRIGFAIKVPIEKSRPQVSVGVVDHRSLVQGFALLKANL